MKSIPIRHTNLWSKYSPAFTSHPWPSNVIIENAGFEVENYVDWQPSSSAVQEHRNWFVEGPLGSRGDSKISACGGGVMLHALAECTAIRYRISNHCITNTRISSDVFRGHAFTAAAPLRRSCIMYRILLKDRHEM